MGSGSAIIYAASMVMQHDITASKLALCTHYLQVNKLEDLN